MLAFLFNLRSVYTNAIKGKDEADASTDCKSCKTI